MDAIWDVSRCLFSSWKEPLVTQCHRLQVPSRSAEFLLQSLCVTNVVHTDESIVPPPADTSSAVVIAIQYSVSDQPCYQPGYLQQRSAVSLC